MVGAGGGATARGGLRGCRWEAQVWGAGGRRLQVHREASESRGVCRGGF